MRHLSKLAMGMPEHQSRNRLPLQQKPITKPQSGARAAGSLIGTLLLIEPWYARGALHTLCSLRCHSDLLHSASHVRAELAMLALRRACLQQLHTIICLVL